MKKIITFSLLILLSFEANSAVIKKIFDKSKKITTFTISMNHQVFFKKSKYGGNSHDGIYVRNIKNGKTLNIYYNLKLGTSPLIKGFKNEIQVTVGEKKFTAHIIKQTKTQQHAIELSPNLGTSISQGHYQFKIKVKFDPRIEKTIIKAEKVEYRIYIKDSEHFLNFKINKIHLKKLIKFLTIKE